MRVLVGRTRAGSNTYRLLIDISRHTVQPQREVAIRYLVVLKETRVLGDRKGLPVIFPYILPLPICNVHIQWGRIGHEQTTIVNGHVEGGIALIDGGEEMLQAVVDGSVGGGIGMQVVGDAIIEFARVVCNALFEPFKAVCVVATLLTHGQQVAALGIEQEKQTIQKGECARKERFEQAVALLGWQCIEIGW